MSQAGGFLSATADQLRRAFDRSFAAVERVDSGDGLDVLAVRVASGRYALRVSELAGLFKDRAVTPVPSPDPDLLGLAGLRGTIVPVYDLRSLLGQPRGEPPRWLVLAAGPETLGLAFDGFEGQLRVAREDIAGTDAAEGALGQAVRTGAVVRRIVDVFQIVEAMKRRARGEGPSQER